MALGNRILARHWDSGLFFSLAYLYSRGQLTGQQALTVMNENLPADDQLEPAEIADIQTVIDHVKNGDVVNGQPMTFYYVQTVLILTVRPASLYDTPAKIEAALGI